MKIRELNLAYIICLSIVIFLSSQGKAQNSIARQAAVRLVIQGDNELQLGRWQQALMSYTNAIETDPDYAEAYMKRGQLNERILRTNEVENDYNRAIFLNPLIDIYYDQRARLRILSFDYYGAVEDITKAIDMNANNVNYLKHQVDGFIALGMYEKALKNLDSTNLKGIDSVYTLQRKSLIHILNDEMSLAEEDINRAFQLDKSDYLTLDLIGLINLVNEDYETALKWFTEAIFVDSSQYISYYNRGVCYRLLGNIELALVDINQSIALNQNQQTAFFKRALIKKEQGDFEGSITDYKAAIMLDSTYEDAIYNRSFSYKVLGNYFNAERDIDFLIKVNDSKAEYWNMKGNLQVLHGEIEASIQSYNEAISVDTDYSEAYFNRGIAYLLQNRTNRACGDFQISVSKGNMKAEEIILNFCNY